LTLSFKGSEGSSLKFNLKDKLSGKTETLTFSLKYWASYTPYVIWGENSGDYIFRQQDGMYSPAQYSSYNNGTISGNQMDFYF
jgi:maltose-binding protein MalE